MSVPHFQTKTEIAAMLAKAGVRPRRRWGQNFLIDGNLLRRLIESAELAPEDAVLEIGAGTGLLTEHLATRAAAVVAVEIDPVLHDIASRRLTGAKNVSLIHADVLHNKHAINPIVREAYVQARRATTGRMHLVANLPYNIATPLLISLLLDPVGFERMCFTVQREMADRITAAPRTKDYGPVSIVIQSACRVKHLANLPPSVFWPPPDVDSTMLRVDVERSPFETKDGLARFAQFVHAGFAHRRKTLRFNLSKALSAATCHSLEEAADLSRRAEELTVDEWINLFHRAPSPD